jgi:peptide/nickel transport system substrate-binding protein
MYSTFAKLEKQILSLPTKDFFSTKKLDNQSYGLHFKVEIGDVFFPTKDFWCSDTLAAWCKDYIERMKNAFFIPYTLSVEFKKNIVHGHRGLSVCRINIPARVIHASPCLSETGTR